MEGPRVVDVTAREEEEADHANAELTTTKVIRTGHSKLCFWTLSCLLPEATQFKVGEMPRLLPAGTSRTEAKRQGNIIKKADTLYVLVVAGNLSKFAGDIGTFLIDYWIGELGPDPTDPNHEPAKCGGWDHVLFVPGPYDYGMGTLDLGDDMLSIYALRHPEGKFTVFERGVTETVLFLGPSVRFVGAACWPVSDVYRDAAVYVVTKELSDRVDQAGGSSAADILLAKRKIAVAEMSFLRNEDAAELLKMDAAIIVRAFHSLPASAREKETRVVVTYGCPDEQLAVNVSAAHPFRGTVSLGSANIYRYLDTQVDWWVYGARGDASRARMGKNIQTVSNHYATKQQAGNDGFEEPFSRMVEIKKK